MPPCRASPRSRALALATRPTDPLFEGVRVFPVSRFKKYLVFYRPIQDGIEVLRVLHGARDIKGLLAGGFEISFDEDDPPHEVPDTS